MIGHGDADQPADLRREHAAGVDDDVGAISGRSPSCSTVTPGDPRPRSRPMATTRCVGPDRARRAAARRRRAPGPGRTGRASRRSAARRRRGRRRSTSAGSGPAPRRRAMRSSGRPKVLAQPAWRSQLLDPLRARRQPERTDLVPRRVDPGLGAQPPVQRRRRTSSSASGSREPRSCPTRPARVERRAAGQLGAIDEDDVGPAELGEVVGDATCRRRHRR